MSDLLDPTSDVLAAWLAEHQQPAYRAGQIRRWLFERRARDWQDMTDLPKLLRPQLAAAFPLWSTSVARHPESAAGTTTRVATTRLVAPSA